MSKSFDPSALPPSVFENRIEQLEREVREARERLDTAQAELLWWRQGLRLFWGEGDQEQEPSDDRAPVEDLSAENQARLGRKIAEAASKPTLREAILTVMRESNRTEWPVLDLIAALQEREWAPTSKNSQDIVRGMVSTMRKRGQLVRVDYGVYALADRMAAGAHQLAVPEEAGAEP